MNSGKNISSAFEVVRQTYGNIYKLFSYIQEETDKRGDCDYKLLTPLPKFLRWKSDQYPDGWLINDFILLFQYVKNVEPLENGWRNGPVYVFEVNLLEDYEEPTAVVARFDYHDMSTWLKDISPSEHWGFYEPLNKWEGLEFTDDGPNFSGIVSGDEAKYWGLKSVRGHYFPLTDITAANAFDKIIGGFERLAGETSDY
ncbi:MAG: hypothetical protein LBL37_08315 [Gracilibacteraceae bacterium]|jgi:hypothetical protein|nr:hypothetical protein [Gracilibacteraceae bacterium]